jgi:peroxiredoxin
VRNQAGVKETDASLKLVVDEDDAVRNELDIPKDFFVLGGRQSYVVDSAGTITAMHNNQFDPESHVAVTLAAAKELPAASPFPFELPDFSALFAGKD